MKTTSPRARTPGAQVWTGCTVLILVILVESWMVWRFGHDCLRSMHEQDSPVEALDPVNGLAVR